MGSKDSKDDALKEGASAEANSLSGNDSFATAADYGDDNDDDSYPDQRSCSESEKQDDDSDYEYDEDLDDDELDRVFEYQDGDSEAYSPEDDLDDPSVNIAEETCDFNGKRFRSGETYYNPTDQKWYTIVRLFPQRKPPKAECEVDMLLSHTFVGPAAELCFNSSCTVRCEHLSTVPVTALVELSEERPKSALIHQREKRSRGFAFYYDDECDSVSSIESIDGVQGLELFAGIGGMSLGFLNVDLSIEWLVEQDELAAANLKQNHPKSSLFVEDVTIFLQNVIARTPGYPRKGDVSFLHLSPPCQGYSPANRNGGRNDQKNNNLTRTVIDAVAALAPPVVVMENVTAILNKGKSDIFKEVIAELLKKDYQVRVCILKACDFGDPQKRCRMFLMAAKKGYHLPSTPLPTHGIADSLEPYVSVHGAISDLANLPVPSANASGVTVLPDPFFPYSLLTYNHKMRNKPTNNVKKLERDQLAPTTISSTQLLHYGPNRLLTIREFMRVHSLPDDMQLFGKDSTLMKAIGNAVPVRLATAVARSVKASLMNDQEENES